MLIESQPLLMIVSGPAGSGKTTLCTRMCEEISEISRVVTSTTRTPRAGEVEGEDYYFFEKKRFEEKIQAGDFYEYAAVHTRYYGTLKSEIDNKFAKNRDLLLNIDVQGAASFRAARDQDPELAQRLVTVFVTATDLGELRRRLAARGTDDDAEIERRMGTAQEEMKEWCHYDYIIDSRSREEDFVRLLSIYRGEKLRTHRHRLLTSD